MNAICIDCKITGMINEMLGKNGQKGLKILYMVCID